MINSRNKTISRMLWALLVVLSAGITSLSQTDRPASASDSKTWVLSIGISKYAKLPGGQQLQFAEKDAIEFADSIQKSGMKPAGVRTLTGAEATTSAIKSAIGNWLSRSASELDTVIIFYSGHGFYEREFKQTYLLAYDSDPKDPFATALSFNEIKEALAGRVRSRRVLLLADALRRDFFDPELDNLAGEAFIRSLKDLSGARDGLSVIMASSPGEFSREGQRWGGHGVFARHLIDSLSGAKGRSLDGSITAEQVFDYLSTNVPGDTSNKQHPWKSESSLAQIVLATGQQNVTNVTAANQVKPHADEKSNQPSGAREQIQTPAPVIKSDSAPAQNTTPVATVKPIEKSSKDSTASAPGTAQRPGKPDKTSAQATSRSNSDGARVDAEPKTASRRDETTIPKSGNEISVNKTVKPDPKKPLPPASTQTPSDALAVNVPASKIEPARMPANTPGATSNLPSPPKPVVAPPGTTSVSSTSESERQVTLSASLPSTQPDIGSASLLMQLEAAIYANALLEPKSSNAWDIYQRLSSDPAASTGLARLKPLLADALQNYGKAIVAGDVRADNIADKVDDFKRAGQLFARARSIQPAGAEAMALEKLSAAQALIALQFYDEAERALAQLQGAKIAAVENSFGLIYQGKLDTWRAERAFKRAIELDSKWAAPHYNLALFYRSQQNQSALGEFEMAASLDRTNTAILVAFGDECVEKQQWERAVEAFKQAIAVKPSDDTLHTKLGNALFGMGKQDEANREYQKARELRNKQ